jgi:predicted cupin superfamily sugar epimerase
MRADKIVEHLRLAPLPFEGGFFRQTYVAQEQLMPDQLPARYANTKPFATAIYYFLADELDSFSALHRLPTDEIYHFYLGSPVELLMLFPDGRGERLVLGHDILKGQRVQLVVPAGVWQGSRVIAGGSYALMGTTMAPGFTVADFEAGQSADLCARYPEYADLIRQLTRSE